MKEYMQNHKKTPRVLILACEFNKKINENLLMGAKQVLSQAQVASDTVWVPGAFELPTAVSKAAAQNKWDAIIALGCVIKGETAHFEYICASVSQQIAELGVKYQMPIIFGVLTPLTLDQALARSGLIAETHSEPKLSVFSKVKHENKGEEAALAALGMIKALYQIQEA